MSQTIEVNADALNELLSQVDPGGFAGWMPKLGIVWTNAGYERAEPEQSQSGDFR
jgi:hypothetical protein